MTTREPATTPAAIPERGRQLPNELPIGRRVAYWRGRRNMSQQLFADRLGKSKSWVDKVERGVRQLDRYSVINEVAGVLRVDVDQLLGNATPPGGGVPSPSGGNARESGILGVDGLRAALERYLPLGQCADGTNEPPSLPELRQAVEHAWLAYQHASYEQLTWGLPRLLRDAQAADEYHRAGDDDTESSHLLAQVYQITSSVLGKLGVYELARLAADRAVIASVRAHDPLLAGVATTRAGNALLALGSPRAALEAHLTAAHKLSLSDAEPATPERLSVFGSLLLQGAMAAAHLGDNATVRELLDGAWKAAVALGSDQNHYWTSFGPTNLQLHRVAAAVELGEGGQAIEIHQHIDPQSLDRLMPERRAHHLLDLARAYAQAGDLTAAAESLLDAERLAPAEIRHRPAARDVVTDILRRKNGSPAVTLSELANRMGIAV